MRAFLIIGVFGIPLRVMGHFADFNVGELKLFEFRVGIDFFVVHEHFFIVGLRPLNDIL